MAAVFTGTPVEIIWAAGSNPAGQTVNIPADATAVYMFWTYWANANGSGLLSATLGGNAPSQTFEVTTSTSGNVATGVAVWYNPPTGNQTLDPAWDSAPGEGPTTFVAFVKDGDTTAWRDADAASGLASDAVSVTLTTASGDLVIKYDQRFDRGSGPPPLSTGWTNRGTGGNNSEVCRLSSISPAGTTQACDSEGEDYSSIVAVSIPPAGVAPKSLIFNPIARMLPLLVR